MAVHRILSRSSVVKKCITLGSRVDIAGTYAVSFGVSWESGGQLPTTRKRTVLFGGPEPDSGADSSAFYEFSFERLVAKQIKARPKLKDYRGASESAGFLPVR